ncbi:MAG: hypothetical protein LBH41_02680 [Rickettsiales bacterium]|jgi:hypothetical protein|nr:hypothetical protein [Rickettsiales bacterium]
MKTIITINGKGGCGKDTLCEIAGRHFRTLNISSITPIKELAAMAGADYDKSDRARKFLGDLKALCAQYNDLPTRYCLGEAEKFLAGGAELMFAHIREPAEIEKFTARARALAGDRADVRTLLVRSKRVEEKVFGNPSDDGVDGYAYDWTYDNDLPLDLAEGDFIAKLESWL